MPKIILASASPHRKQLLKNLIGDNFGVQVSDYEEDNTLNLVPKDLVLHHSLEKGRDIVKKFPESVIISADTVAEVDGQVLGKPHTPENAIKMLKLISDKKIKIFSAVTVIYKDKELSDFEETELEFKKMSDKEIQDYVDTGEPLDKAGAFAIGYRASIFIETIKGCYFTIEGLPIFKLNKLLNEIGISIFDYKI